LLMFRASRFIHLTIHGPACWRYLFAVLIKLSVSGEALVVFQVRLQACLSGWRPSRRRLAASRGGYSFNLTAGGSDVPPFRNI